LQPYRSRGGTCPVVARTDISLISKACGGVVGVVKSWYKKVKRVFINEAGWCGSCGIGVFFGCRFILICNGYIILYNGYYFYLR
jgi:hypothetical protein